MVQRRRAHTPKTQVSSPGFLRGSTDTLSVGTIHLPCSAFMNRFAILDTLDSDPVPPDVVRNIRSPSIAIRVKLVGKVSGREISACALLDSGAKGLIIHEDYAKRNISKTTKNLSLLGTFHHFWAVQQVHKVAQGCTSCKVPESGQVIIWEYNNKVYFGYIVQTTN